MDLAWYPFYRLKRHRWVAKAFTAEQMRERERERERGGREIDAPWCTNIVDICWCFGMQSGHANLKVHWPTQLGLRCCLIYHSWGQQIPLQETEKVKKSLGFHRPRPPETHLMAPRLATETNFSWNFIVGCLVYNIQHKDNRFSSWLAAATRSP